MDNIYIAILTFLGIGLNIIFIYFVTSIWLSQRIGVFLYFLFFSIGSCVAFSGIYLIYLNAERYLPPERFFIILGFCAAPIFFYLLLGRKVSMTLDAQAKYIRTKPSLTELQQVLAEPELIDISMVFKLANSIFAQLSPMVGYKTIEELYDRCKLKYDIFSKLSISEQGEISYEKILMDVRLDKSTMESIIKGVGELITLTIAKSIEIAGKDTVKNAVSKPIDAVESDIKELMSSKRYMLYGSLLYGSGLFLLLPNGVAEGAKARTISYVLFKKFLEKIIANCSGKAILKIKSVFRGLDETKNLELSEHGVLESYTIIMIPDNLSTKEDKINGMINLFSSLMESVYPIAREDLGEESLANISKTAVSSAINDVPSLLKYDVLRAIPGSVPLPDEYKIAKMGRCYLIAEEGLEFSVKIFNKIVSEGYEGLCITRLEPQLAKSEHNINSKLYWLTKKEYASHLTLNPTNLLDIYQTINDFVTKNKQAVILLDGLEFLVVNRDFPVVLKFMEDLNELVMRQRCRAIIPIDQKIFNERELALLKRNMEFIKPGGR